jgi:hypothetical protein
MPHSCCRLHEWAGASARGLGTGVQVWDVARLGAEAQYTLTIHVEESIEAGPEQHQVPEIPRAEAHRYCWGVVRFDDLAASENRRSAMLPSHMCRIVALG